MRRALACLLTPLAGACSVLPTAGERATREPQIVSRPATTGPETRACFDQLGARGVAFRVLPDRYLGPGCTNFGTVSLASLRGDANAFTPSNLGPVTCPLARVFADWARFGVDRAARQELGVGLARIETFGSYACRNIGGSGRRSAHSTADAIDVSGFLLTDGRRITLARDWTEGGAAEQRFLRLVHRSACRRFGTVLGPEYNAAHEDHFHLERSDTNFCR